MGHFIPDKIKQSISQHFQLLRENRLLFAFVGTAEECIYSFPTSFGWSILGVQHACAWMRFAFTHMDHNPKRCCSLWASCLVVTACHKQPEKELPQVQSQLRVGQQLHSLKKTSVKAWAGSLTSLSLLLDHYEWPECSYQYLCCTVSKEQSSFLKNKVVV